MIRSGVQLLNWGLLLKVTLYAVLFAWLIYQLIGILPQQENPDEKPSPEVVAKVEALQPIIQQLVFVIHLDRFTNQSGSLSKISLAEI